MDKGLKVLIFLFKEKRITKTRIKRLKIIIETTTATISIEIGMKMSNTKKLKDTLTVEITMAVETVIDTTIIKIIIEVFIKRSLFRLYFAQKF
jgi:hypothetical protein